MSSTTSAPYTSELAAALAGGLVERFVRYCRVDTQSDRSATGTPSSPGQLDLGRLLAEELDELGLDDVVLDAHGYVTAGLRATVPDAPVVGLLAHVDVSPDAPGAGVEPIVHERYDGGRIELPRGGTVLDPEAMVALRAAVGHDVVTSSGDTLLGADDKAGVAEIMTAVAHLAAHPELPRPHLRVCFSPDEEIGHGASLLDLERFGAEAAYTVDGSELGELQAETFSGAEVVMTFTGVDIHPGFATGRLVNALKLAGRVLAALPTDGWAPETTEGREGFVHPVALTGDATRARLTFIARDFEQPQLDAHVERLRAMAEEVVAAAPGAQVEVGSRPQYPNMRDHLTGHPEVVDRAQAAITAEGLEVHPVAIRGGTDGSQLSARGLPTPNLFTGGHEYHSVREWASVPEMAAASAVLVHLAAAWAAA